MNKMKLILCFFFVFCLASTESHVKIGRLSDEKCNYHCDTYYDVICAADFADPDAGPKLFVSQCMLDTFNCLNDANYAEISLDACMTN